MMNKMMNKILKNISFALISLVLIALIFSVGFFSGRNNLIGSPIGVPGGLPGGTVDASDDYDFSSFWKVWNLIDQRYVPVHDNEPVANQERVWGAISGMVNSLGDPYTQFLPPVENEHFESAIQGNFTGVGMEIGVEDEFLTVIAPLKNTPAEKAGIKSGDVIVAIDGVTTQLMGLDDAVNRIRGEAGTEVVLTIFREDIEEPFDISVTRDVIDIPTIDTETIDNVFVIHLYNFSANAEGDFRTALREFILSRKSRLILDLRGNPGGFLDAAVDISSWFLPVGKVVVKESFGDGEEKVFRSKGYNIFSDNLKMLILVDKGSASASEIVAGALQEHGIAKLIGPTNTFGKGSVQELIDITPETALKVTIARWLTPNGESISDGGLTPDIQIEKAPEDINVYEYQLEEAVKALKEM